MGGKEQQDHTIYGCHGFPVWDKNNKIVTKQKREIFDVVLTLFTQELERFDHALN